MFDIYDVPKPDTRGRKGRFFQSLKFFDCLLSVNHLGKNMNIN